MLFENVFRVERYVSQGGEGPRPARHNEKGNKESAKMTYIHLTVLWIKCLPVVFLQVSIALSGGARESRDNVSGLPNGLEQKYNRLGKYEPAHAGPSG